MFLGLACDSLAAPPEETREPIPDTSPPTEVEPTDSLLGGAGQTAPDLTLGLGGALTSALEPEPQEDPCVVAAQNGAIFCEPGMASLEYCVEAPRDGAPCAAYERPPSWLYDLLIQCVAHCGVGIATSQRELDRACCYVGVREYYGR